MTARISDNPEIVLRSLSQALDPARNDGPDEAVIHDCALDLIEIIFARFDTLNRNLARVADTLASIEANL